MFQTKTILVPVDFSECSKVALERAGALAHKLQARLHVMHVWELPEAVPPAANEGLYTGQLLSMVEAFAGTRLRELVQEARDKGIAIDGSFLEMGAAWRTIVELAGQRHYDLIVMGTHGRRGLAHALIGSVAEKVVRCAPCPVMAVHGNARPHPASVGRILVPVDYSAGSAHALDYATRLSGALGAEIDVVHIWDRPSFVSDQAAIQLQDGRKQSLGELVRENVEREMVSFLEAQRTTPAAALPPHRLLSGEPASTLLSELERGDHDLVVMGTRGRTGLKHLLLGSVAEKIVRLSPVPVVTVPLRA
jgi:nucleotide-binding universal stress UspA family protein